MKKKWMAALLCLMMILQVTGTPTYATETIYFMGLEENVLALSDATMPFWHGNYLYIPSSTFTGAVRGDAPIRQTLDHNGEWVALYQKGTAILFKESTNYGEDSSGKIYYPGAVKRNGQFYVPVSVVASYFDLTYSVIKVDRGWLVWLRSPGFILTDTEFANAASGVLEHRYQEYAAKKAEEKPPTPPTPNQPEAEEVLGKKIYLSLKGTENTGLLLDMFDRYNAKVTVFCTPEFMNDHPDLLRRITGTGHGIGILAEDSLPTPVLEQIRAGNQALDQATCGKTRLVRIENAGDETLEAVEAAGYLPEISQLKIPAETLASNKGANTLFHKISASPKESILWVGDELQLSGVRTFLEQTKQHKDHCLPLTETVTIT